MFLCYAGYKYCLNWNVLCYVYIIAIIAAPAPLKLHARQPAAVPRHEPEPGTSTGARDVPAMPENPSEFPRFGKLVSDQDLQGIMAESIPAETRRKILQED